MPPSWQPTVGPLTSSTTTICWRSTAAAECRCVAVTRGRWAHQRPREWPNHPAPAPPDLGTGAGGSGGMIGTRQAGRCRKELTLHRAAALFGNENWGRVQQPPESQVEVTTAMTLRELADADLTKIFTGEDSTSYRLELLPDAAHRQPIGAVQTGRVRVEIYAPDVNELNKKIQLVKERCEVPEGHGMTPPRRAQHGWTSTILVEYR